MSHANLKQEYWLLLCKQKFEQLPSWIPKKYWHRWWVENKIWTFWSKNSLIQQVALNIWWHGQSSLYVCGYSHEHDGDCYHTYNQKMKQVPETKDVIWLKWMYYMKQDNTKVWHKWRVYVTKYKNPEIKVENESNKFLKGDPGIDVMLKAEWVKEFVDIKEWSPDQNNTFLHMVRTGNGWISLPPEHQFSEMGNTVAKINHWALLA